MHREMKIILNVEFQPSSYVKSGIITRQDKFIILVQSGTSISGLRSVVNVLSTIMLSCCYSMIIVSFKNFVFDINFHCCLSESFSHLSISLRKISHLR